ncbi:heterokaryon incompatibility protein [Apiospora hydei]|uniref:Heterokaryon incompatibility protein n=1 Tax=Apiospora hydei TaxID=1337664 RepID=A0ABR1VYZ8_9PEZI
MASVPSLLPHKYQPLPDDAQTRILELQPSTGGTAAQLCCRLRNFDVYGDTEYQAVSYAWGEPRFTEPLVVDDDYYLMTTPNFRDALLRFRLPDRPRRLWVDAVCINQKDEKEKGRQIPFMSMIYSGATRVLVWLGDYPRAADSIWELEQLWVIQEVVLNPDVTLYCGSAMLSWTRFAQAVRLIENQPLWPSLPSTVCDLWILRMFGGNVAPRFDAVKFLQDLSVAKCFDDRDKIWAMSALATDLEIRKPDAGAFNDSNKLCLEVDYSMDAGQLYLEFAKRTGGFRHSERRMSKAASFG